MLTDSPYRMLLHHLHRAALFNDRLADRELSAAIGVGRTQFLVLRTVQEAPELAASQQMLADHLGLTKAAMSRHIIAAEGQGWLSIDTAHSRREHTLVLTRSGRSLVTRGRAVQDRAERRTAHALGVDRLTATAETLAELSAMLEEQLSAPGDGRSTVGRKARSSEST